VRNALAARPKIRENRIEAMFKADVQGVIDFTAIQWCGLRIARKKTQRNGWIVQNVSRLKSRTLIRPP